MKFNEEESGQTLVVIALCMTVLLGFLALAVDVGMLFQTRRNMQIAADAAAVAAALDYKYNSSTTSAKTAACGAVAANGITATCTINSQCSGVTTTTVCVNDPPLNGYHKAIGYTEAIVVDPAPTVFMNMFHIKSVNVMARAVAGGGLNDGCIWALSTSGTDVSLTGSGSIAAPTCEIYDDSNASNAMTLTGSGSITAKEIGIVGNNPGYSVTGSGHLSPNPPTTGIGPATNPLSLTPPTITAPSTGVCSSNCNQSYNGTGSTTVPAGTYTSISNTGSGTMTLSPGTIVTGNVSTTGSGSMIFPAGNYSIGGTLSNNGSGSLTLGAGNYAIGGNLTNTGSGALALGVGNYSIGGSLNNTGSSTITIGSGSANTMIAVGGSLSLTGSQTQNGTNVTFYTAGSDTITGSGNTNISAPTSGAYSGVLIYQPSNSTFSITGSAGDSLNGILYAPSARLSLTGSGNMRVSLDIIVDTLTVTGSGTITDTNYAVVTNPNSVLSKLVMVE